VSALGSWREAAQQSIASKAKVNQSNVLIARVLAGARKVKNTAVPAISHTDTCLLKP